VFGAPNATRQNRCRARHTVGETCKARGHSNPAQHLKQLQPAGGLRAARCNPTANYGVFKVLDKENQTVNCENGKSPFSIYTLRIEDAERADKFINDVIALFNPEDAGQPQQ
jgi:hypothetical protein